jgi:membrane protein implicated in regulation of membrane protease activity
MANLKWIAVALGVLVALYLLTQMQQSGLQTQSDAVFPDDQGAIQVIEMWTKDDTLKIEREGESWALAGHDSLQIRPDRMETFLDKALDVKRETLISKNPEKWHTYSVDDSTGTHVKLVNASGKELAYVVFGRSMTDWSHNYVRVPGVDEVYLTDESVLHMLYPKASYWGEKPVVVEEDGLGVDAAGEMSGAVVDTSK